MRVSQNNNKHMTHEAREERRENHRLKENNEKGAEREKKPKEAILREITKNQA